MMSRVFGDLARPSEALLTIQSRMLSVPLGRVIDFGQFVSSPPFNPHSTGSHRERDHCMLVAPMWCLCFGDRAFVAFPATSARTLSNSPRLGNPILVSHRMTLLPALLEGSRNNSPTWLTTDIFCKMLETAFAIILQWRSCDGFSWFHRWPLSIGLAD